MQRALLIAKQRALGKQGEADAEVIVYQTRLQELQDSFSKLSKRVRVTYSQDKTANNGCIQFLSYIKAAKKMEAEMKDSRHYLDAQSASLANLRKKDGDKPNQVAKIESLKAQVEKAEEAYEQSKLSFMQVVKGLDKKKDSQWQKCIETLCNILKSMQPGWNTNDAILDQPDDQKEDDVAEADQADLANFLAASDDENQEEEVEEYGEAGSGSFLVGTVAPTPVGKQRRVRVKFEHDGSAEEGELSIQPGDIILVVDDSTEGWWTGRKEDGSEGLFPENYTELIED